jgi:hypothetical protein
VRSDDERNTTVNGDLETGRETTAQAADATPPGAARPPWLARRDWAAGRVVAERRRLLVLPWGIFLLAAVLFVPSVWLTWRRIADGAQKLDLWFFVLVAFALIVLGVFGRKAFLQTRQALRFEPAALHLDAVPIAIGGELRGTIAAPVELRPGERVRLELACVAHTAGSGGDSGSAGHDRTVWRESREVAAGATRPAAEGSVVPVEMPVAAHPPETGSSETGSVRWSLTATLLPSRRWREVFDLPVFRTGESPPVEVREPPSSFREALQQAKEDLAAGRLHPRFGPGGVRKEGR